jgi:hypothetical protein
VAHDRTQRQVCEHGNEQSYSVTLKEFLHQLNKHQFLVGCDGVSHVFEYALTLLLLLLLLLLLCFFHSGHFASRLVFRFC